MVEWMASHYGRRDAAIPKQWQPAVAVAANMLHWWLRTQVMLRVDNEFAGALLTSETDVPLVPDWLVTMPYESVACSFPKPVSLFDGEVLCHYRGFIVTGTRHDLSRTMPSGRIWTHYGPMAEGDGLRFLWLYNQEGDDTPRAQTISVALRGRLAQESQTVQDLIDVQSRMGKESGENWGQEMSSLVPLSIQLVLYLAAREPDLEWIPSGAAPAPAADPRSPYR